jgi:hypothetical protein
MKTTKKTPYDLCREYHSQSPAKKAYLAAQANWFQHRDSCPECRAAYEAKEPTECKVGDELVSIQDHKALEMVESK